MAVYKRDILDIELNSGSVSRSFLKHSIGMADANADHFGVRTFRDGVPVDLSGVSVQGFFRNSEGTNIAITSGNVVSGNEAEVVLPAVCYNYDGPFTLAIKLIGGDVTGTMRIVDGMVDNTNTGGAVAPSDAVPTYQEILATYDAMVAATSAANTAIAETFDATKAYPAGKYVINDGALYRITSDHAANVTWANTSKVATKLGEETSDLKSALTLEQKSSMKVNDLLIYNGYRLLSTNGNMSSSANHKSSDYIPVKSGDTIKYRLRGTDSTVGVLCFYNSEKVFDANSVIKGAGASVNKEGTFTVPSDGYVRFCSRVDYSDPIAYIVNDLPDFATDYVPILIDTKIGEAITAEKPLMFADMYSNATVLSANTDLNTITTDGIYVVNGTNSPTLVNAPSGISSGCMLEVKRSGYGTPNYDVQLFYSGGSKRIYYRYNWGGVWSEWDSFAGLKDLPSPANYDQTQIDNVFSLSDWKRGGSTKRNFSLMMFSDIHGDTTRLEKAVDLLNSIDAIDAGIMLGDIEDSTQSSSMASKYIPELNKATKTCLATMGNHDFHHSKSMTSNPYNLAESVERFMGAMNDSSVYSEHGYGYKDFATYKIRLIVLNQYEYPDANDGTNWTYYGSGRFYQQGQIDWLINTLNSVPADYHVIIAQHSTEPADTQNDVINTHYNAYGSGGNRVNGVDAHSTYIGSLGYMSDAIIGDIIKAYQGKTTLAKNYTYSTTSTGFTGVSVDADFSNANGTFACLICGHNHAQAFCKQGDTIPVYVNDTSSCLYGWATEYSLIARNQKGYSGNLMTVLCVDTANKYLHFVRIGASRTFFGELYDVVSVPYD